MTWECATTVRQANETATSRGPTVIARIKYGLTDKRFTRWGKYSKVLVPRLAEKIAPYAEAASEVGDAYLAYDAYNVAGECADEQRGIW